MVKGVHQIPFDLICSYLDYNFKVGESGTFD